MISVKYQCLTCDLDTLITLLNLVLPKRKIGHVVPKGHPGFEGQWPEFIAPKEGDSRCSCPAINSMANHGQLTFKPFHHMSTCQANLFDYRQVSFPGTERISLFLVSSKQHELYKTKSDDCFRAESRNSLDVQLRPHFLLVCPKFCSRLSEEEL